MATRTTYTPLGEISINGMFYQVISAVTTETISEPTPEEVAALIPAKEWAWAESFGDPDERDLARADLVYAAEQGLRQERQAARKGTMPL